MKEESEPDIYHAIRYGALLENVVLNEKTREVDYEDESITPNTRVSYPIEYIENIRKPCVATHPKDVIFLTADAFGVYHHVSKLTDEQIMFHFIGGYTSKIPGTEWELLNQSYLQPMFWWSIHGLASDEYAELLRDKIKAHDTNVWLVNTGWHGGGYGIGKRYAIKDTRRIIHAIQNGELQQTNFTKEGYFGLDIPTNLEDSQMSN